MRYSFGRIKYKKFNINCLADDKAMGIIYEIKGW
jgi:hypothetical protein